jgi:hypothetical protein
MFPSGRLQWLRGIRHELSSNAAIVGSNPNQGMNVCVPLFCVYVVLFVGSGLDTL